MHIAEVVTIAKSLPLLRLNTYKSLILSYSADYRRIFSKSQVRSISEKFGLNLNAQIVCLSPSQWVNCFLEMLEVVPEKFHPS